MTSASEDVPGPSAPQGPQGALPALVVRLRADKLIADVNEALCFFYGVTVEEVLGRPFSVLLAAEDVPGMLAAMDSLSRDHRSILRDARAATAGKTRWVRWTHVAIFAETGHLFEVHSFGRDVTHERRMEEDAARLAAIVAGADDAVISKTLQGVVTSWNPGAEAMFGFSAAEAVGRSISFIIPHDRLQEETEILARLQRGEKTEHFQTERLHKAGRLVAVSVNVSPVRDSSGRVIGASKIVRDVTDQRRSQGELKASLRSLEVLYRLADTVGQAATREEVCEVALDAITSAVGTERASVLVFDASGVMRFIAWRKLSGHYRQAMDGHSPWTHESPSPAPILVEDVLTDASMESLRPEIVREGIRGLAFFPLVYQGRLLGKFMVYFDGPRSLTAAECRLAETIGRHVAFGIARVDAEMAATQSLRSERIAREDAEAARGEAELANRAKDEFLAMLAHELRNPLGVIVHAAAILGKHQGLHPELAPPVGMIERQSRHLARLLDDLLDLARITSGHIEMDRARVVLQKVVTAAVETERIRINAKGQRVTVSTPADPISVMGDGVRLQQVVGNMLNNAIKYTPSGGSIEIALLVDAGDAVIRVSDTGVGIPLDRQDAIFELFVQANPTLARTEGGLGIGLTLVRRVVAFHQGRVEARSPGLGKGSVFVVRLPLAPAVVREGETAPREPNASPPPQGAPRRILVIEDQEDGREAFATLLRLQGHDVFVAATGQEGVALALEQKPDVVLVDIGLPDLDGYQVAEAVRRRLGGRVQLVAVTGYGQPSDRSRAIQAGFDAHLVKPVESEAIAQLLAGLAPALRH